jgi:hypothetical protein
VLPATAAARVDEQQLKAETLAVGRYLLASGELPPRVAASLQTFLRSHAPWSTSGGGWAVARLGVLVAPDDGAARLALIRQNGALGGWREPNPSLLFVPLCERAAAVEAYATRAPGPRADALRRFLRATPPELPADDGGLRYAVIGAERDEAAASLLVRLRVTNPGGEERPLPLDKLRLSGLESAPPPEVDPPASRLPAGQVRELRLTFAGVTDEVAEATVLLVRPDRPDLALQAYSEDLR